MKRAIYSKNIPGENRDKFTEAGNLAADGIVLDYHDSNLYKRPARNFYTLQSIKTGLPIIGITLEHFFVNPFFSENDEQEVLKHIAEAVQVSGHMKVPLLIIPFDGASTIDTQSQFVESARRLRFACAFAGGLQVNIGIHGNLSKEDIDRLIATVDHENLVDITHGVDGWRMVF